jgi:hypothetical protein
LHIIQYHNQITVNGVIHDLTHLNASSHVITGHGHDGSDIKVRISFMSHVYSQVCNLGVHDLLDEARKPRMFCTDRHTLSQDLSNFCGTFIRGNGITWESKDRNQINSLMVVENANGQGVDYAIIYTLSPSRSDLFDVEMLVKSAYGKENIIQPNRRYNIRVLIKKCYYQQKTIP